jgi:hypothetical protein
MEARLGHDFSGVRVHTGPGAAEPARRVNTRAFTVGQDVVLGANAPPPQSKEGQRLLAHELAHVVQQQAGADVAEPSETSIDAEREADGAATAFARGDTFAVRARSGVTVACETDPPTTQEPATPERRVIYLDKSVFDQINRNNRKAASTLQSLRAEADVRIADWTYYELVERPDFPRTKVANRLLLEQLRIPVDDPVPIAQRVDLVLSATPPKGVTGVSERDTQMLIGARARGGERVELWSFDKKLTSNPPNIEVRFGVRIAPESNIPFQEGRADYRVGRQLLGLEPVEISFGGTIRGGPSGGGPSGGGPSGGGPSGGHAAEEATPPVTPKPGAADEAPTADGPAKGRAARSRSVPQTVQSPMQEHPAGPAVGHIVQQVYAAEQRTILAYEWSLIEADIDARHVEVERWRGRGEWVALYAFVEVPVVPNVLEFVHREPWELPHYRFISLVHGPDASSVARPPATLGAPAPDKRFLTFQVLSPEEQVPHVPYGHQVVSLPGDFASDDGVRTMHLQIVGGELRATLRSIRDKLTVVAAATVHLPEPFAASVLPPARVERDDLYIELTFRGDSGELFRSRLRFAPDGFNEELLSVSSGRTSRSFWPQVR